MTAKELIAKLSEWIESINRRIVEAAQEDDEPAILLDEMAVEELTEVLQEAREQISILLSVWSAWNDNA